MIPVETAVPLSSVNWYLSGKAHFYPSVDLLPVVSVDSSSYSCVLSRWASLILAYSYPYLFGKRDLCSESVWKFRSCIKWSKVSFLDVFFKLFKSWYKITNTFYIILVCICIWLCLYIYIHIYRIMAMKQNCMQHYLPLLCVFLVISTLFSSTLFYFIKKKKKNASHRPLSWLTDPLNGVVTCS